MELITVEDCQELLGRVACLQNQISQIKSKYKLVFNGESYLTGPELCEKLKITKRTLQEYRDTRLIPYITIGGKFLYKESDIHKILEENYTPSIDY